MCRKCSFYCVFFLMRRRPPRSTLTDTLFPSTTLFRSLLKSLALARSSVEFRLSHNGKPVRIWKAARDEQAQLQRVAEVLGEDFPAQSLRSEEHTSELQSLMRISYAVFCLKKKSTITNVLQSSA